MGNGCGNGMGDLYFVWKRFCVKRGRWWKMTGKRSLVRLWKIGVMGLTVGLCVGFISPADCFASELMRGIEQRKGQVEVTRGDLPEITGDVEKGNVNGDIGADWEEDFTDTDIRRGILAVRSEVFQGFGGGVRIVVKEMEGGRETVISLTGESDYMANRELRPGRYQVVSVEADSDGRKFDCLVEPEEMDVDTDKVMMCRVFVRPGSVYQVADEETENEIAERRERQGDILEKGEEETEAGEYEEKNVLGAVAGRTKDGKRLLVISAILGMSVSIGRMIQVKRGRRREE